jgi:hypothetical protein
VLSLHDNAVSTPKNAPKAISWHMLPHTKHNGN